jgi:hypothetical protein
MKNSKERMCEARITWQAHIFAGHRLCKPRIGSDRSGSVGAREPRPSNLQATARGCGRIPFRKSYAKEGESENDRENAGRIAANQKTNEQTKLQIDFRNGVGRGIERDPLQGDLRIWCGLVEATETVCGGSRWFLIWWVLLLPACAI